MALGGIVRLTVRQGEEAAFEEAFLALRTEVLAREPGCLMYDLYRARTGAQDYVILERWADEAALAHHRAAPHMKDGLARLAPLVASSPGGVFYDQIA